MSIAAVGHKELSEKVRTKAFQAVTFGLSNRIGLDKIIEALNALNSDPKSKASQSYREMLFHTAYNHRADVLQYLKDNGTDLTIIDPKTGGNLIHSWASTTTTTTSKSSHETLKMLLDAGCKIDQQDNDLNTPLHVAISSMKLLTHPQSSTAYAVMALIKDGASTSLKNAEGFTARDVALSRGNNIALQIFDDFTKPTATAEGNPIQLLEKAMLALKTQKEATEADSKEQKAILIELIHEKIALGRDIEELLPYLNKLTIKDFTAKHKDSTIIQKAIDSHHDGLITWLKETFQTEQTRPGSSISDDSDWVMLLDQSQGVEQRSGHDEVLGLDPED